jgi:hypothetical protein
MRVLHLLPALFVTACMLQQDLGSNLIKKRDAGSVSVISTIPASTPQGPSACRPHASPSCNISGGLVGLRDPFDCAVSVCQHSATASSRHAEGTTVPLLGLLPSDNEVGSWVSCSRDLLTDETSLMEQIDGAAPKYVDRGWKQSVETKYSQDNAPLTLVVHDMGTSENAESIYRFNLAAEPEIDPLYPNACLKGMVYGYATMAWIGPFFIEITIEVDDSSTVGHSSGSADDSFDTARNRIWTFTLDVLSRGKEMGL